MVTHRGLSVREIGNVAVAEGARYFERSGGDGNGARGWAVYVGEVLSARHGKKSNRVFARILMLLGCVKPAESEDGWRCSCERCRR